MSAAGNVTTVARSVAVSTGMSVIRRDSTTHDDDSNAPLGKRTPKLHRGLRGFQ